MMAVPTGILLPDTVLQAEWFQVLAAFVALNTLVYVTLAVAKMLPKAHPTDWWYRVRGSNRRAESRSIYPLPPGEEPGR